MPIYECTGKRLIFRCELIHKCTDTCDEPPKICFYDRLPIKWVLKEETDQQTSSKP